MDDAIFCAHGGIPFTAKTTEEIVAVKRDIREPEQESDIAWEILWSDPAGMQEFLDSCEVRDVDPDTANGFVFNTKRGTAYKFNEQGRILNNQPCKTEVFIDICMLQAHLTSCGRTC